jgi:hypothetical protein
VQDMDPDFLVDRSNGSLLQDFQDISDNELEVITAMSQNDGDNMKEELALSYPENIEYFEGPPGFREEKEPTEEEFEVARARLLAGRESVLATRRLAPTEQQELVLEESGEDDPIMEQDPNMEPEEKPVDEQQSRDKYKDDEEDAKELPPKKRKFM